MNAQANELPRTHGPLVQPGEHDYDAEMAGYNLSVEHHPALVVGAVNAADVVSAVGYAGEHGMPVAVQATGHGVSVPADGAVFINTRRMTGIRIEPATRTARIEAGVQSVALATRPTTSAHWRSSPADGRLRKVTQRHDPDLFWALRGGKGNFGVVVAMAIDLMPVTRLYGGGMYFPAEATADLLHTYRSWVDTVPEEMGSSVLLIRLPDVPGVLEPLRGRYVSHVRIAYSGTPDEGERLVRPLRDVGVRLLDTVRDMPYRDVGSIHNEPATPVAFYAKNTMLRSLGQDTVDALLALAGPDAKAPYLHRGLAPWGTGGVCLNFLTGPDVSTEELRSAYLPADFTRLAHLKGRYDPDNMFRINHNIPPA